MYATEICIPGRFRQLLKRAVVRNIAVGVHTACCLKIGIERAPQWRSFFVQVIVNCTMSSH